MVACATFIDRLTLVSIPQCWMSPLVTLTSAVRLAPPEVDTDNGISLMFCSIDAVDTRQQVDA